jgi:benzoyl-CoA 2,3-dioxygenase component A
VTATCVGNVRVTEVGKDYDTHHVVLDFGAMPFPVLEGQSIGIIPPGQDARGQPHFARQYSVASARNGERPGYNNVSLTIKRVLQDYEGNPVRGVASNFMCDLKVGDKVQVIGPFGSTFLMPNHPKSHIVMICTGTGSAPMRAMTEWRRRLRKSGKFEGGRLLLFFGARSKEELPYFGPLQSLPRDFIDIHFAFSRTPASPRPTCRTACASAPPTWRRCCRTPTASFTCAASRRWKRGDAGAARRRAGRGAELDRAERAPEEGRAPAPGDLLIPPPKLTWSGSACPGAWPAGGTPRRCGGSPPSGAPAAGLRWAAVRPHRRGPQQWAATVAEVAAARQEGHARRLRAVAAR